MYIYIYTCSMLGLSLLYIDILLRVLMPPKGSRNPWNGGRLWWLVFHITHFNKGPQLYLGGGNSNRFWNFHPESMGKWFPILTSIFFKGLVRPPTSKETTRKCMRMANEYQDDDLEKVRPVSLSSFVFFAPIFGVSMLEIFRAFWQMFSLETRPDFWENPTVSMGLGPLQSVCQVRLVGIWGGVDSSGFSAPSLQIVTTDPRLRVFFGEAKFSIFFKLGTSFGPPIEVSRVKRRVVSRFGVFRFLGLGTLKLRVSTWK